MPIVQLMQHLPKNTFSTKKPLHKTFLKVVTLILFCRLAWLKSIRNTEQISTKDDQSPIIIILYMYINNMKVGCSLKLFT